MDEPVLVLCFFRYWARFGAHWQIFDDSIMVECHCKEQVLPAFARAVAERKRRNWGVGPEPHKWELLAWLPQRKLSWAH